VVLNKEGLVNSKLISMALLLVPAVSATSVPRAVTLDAASAQQIIAACVEHATSKKQSHAIAVVDAAGGLLAFLRMDGNPPGVGEFALQKAIAVAKWRFSTERMTQSAKETPGFSAAPYVVTVGGGVPIYANGAFVGSAGASGEAASDDAECVTHGVRAAGFSEAPR
jgi:glc operon protein GlcG